MTAFNLHFVKNTLLCVSWIGERQNRSKESSQQVLWPELGQWSANIEKWMDLRHLLEEK